MKKTSLQLILLLFICTFNIVSAQENDKIHNKAEKRILENFDEIVRCWNNQDLDCYMKAYSTKDELQTINKGGVTFGYDKILNNFKKHFPKDKMGILSFDNFNFRKLTNRLYFVTGKFYLKSKDKEKPFSSWFSVIMKRYNGQWFIVTDHS